MPTLLNNFNWGSAIYNKDPELTRQLSQAYTATASAVNSKVSRFVSPDANPPANDNFNKNWSIGDLYVRSDTNKVWVMTSRTTDTAVTWSLLN